MAPPDFPVASDESAAGGDGLACFAWRAAVRRPAPAAPEHDDQDKDADQEQGAEAGDHGIEQDRLAGLGVNCRCRALGRERNRR
jgi:hypothetical protein